MSYFLKCTSYIYLSETRREEVDDDDDKQKTGEKSVLEVKEADKDGDDEEDDGGEDGDRKEDRSDVLKAKGANNVV